MGACLGCCSWVHQQSVTDSTHREGRLIAAAPAQGPGHTAAAVHWGCRLLRLRAPHTHTHSPLCAVWDPEHHQLVAVWCHNSMTLKGVASANNELCNTARGHFSSFQFTLVRHAFERCLVLVLWLSTAVRQARSTCRQHTLHARRELRQVCFV